MRTPRLRCIVWSDGGLQAVGWSGKAQPSCFVAASLHICMHAHAGAAALLRSQSAVACPKSHGCRLPLTAACPLLRTKLIRMHGKRPKDTGVALALYDEMRQDGIPPDAVCFNTCLTAAGKQGRGGCGVRWRPRQQAGGAAARLCVLHSTRLLLGSADQLLAVPSPAYKH